MPALVVAVVAALLAHGGIAAQDSTDHRAEIVGFEPAAAGLSARLVDAGTRIELDAGDHEVVVLGYEGEPYLLVDHSGVYENVATPTTYLNRSLDGEVPPPTASFRSPPEWVRVGDGPRVRWHDHALHVPPGQQLGSRDESTWRVPLRVDGEEIVLVGRMVALPAVPAWPWYVLAAAVALGAVAAGRAGRARSPAPHLTPMLLGALVAADVLRLYGITFGVPGWLAGRWEVFSAEARWSAIGWALAAGALVLHRRRLRLEAAAATLAAAAVIGFAGGVLDLDDLAARRVLTALPEWLSRGSVALVLGLGLGLVARASLDLRRAVSRPAPP